ATTAGTGRTTSGWRAAGRSVPGRTRAGWRDTGGTGAAAGSGSRATGARSRRSLVERHDHERPVVFGRRSSGVGFRLAEDRVPDRNGVGRRLAGEDPLEPFETEGLAGRARALDQPVGQEDDLVPGRQRPGPCRELRALRDPERKGGQRQARDAGSRNAVGGELPGVGEVPLFRRGIEEE